MEDEKQGGYCNQVVRDKGLNYVEKQRERKA